MNILKLIAAVFVGLMVGVVVIFIVETMSHSIYPPPENIDLTSKDALAKIISQAPVGALLFVILAYCLGSFIGGAVTHLISRLPKQRDALLTGLILLIFGAYNLTHIPHPTWMVILGIVCFLPSAYLGGWLVRRRNRSPE